MNNTNRTFVLVATICTCCTICADDVPLSEAEKLSGLWTVTSLQIKGREKISERKNLRFEFNGSKMIRMEDGEINGEMIFTVHPEKTPKWMDVVEDKKIPAIYELNGDSLVICFRSIGRQRPKAFDGTKGTDQILIK